MQLVPLAKRLFTMIGDAYTDKIEIIRCGIDTEKFSPRLHSTIFALSMHTPVVAIAYEFKTIEFMRQLDLEEYVVDIEDMTLSLLKHKAIKAWENRMLVSRSLPGRIDKIKEKCIKNIQLIIRHLP